MNWLLSCTVGRSGSPRGAAVGDAWRTAGLAQLGDFTFGEYYEPLTGETLGSADQSWTAAAALDWLGGAAAL